jgi:hypothetical protein
MNKRENKRQKNKGKTSLGNPRYYGNCSVASLFKILDLPYRATLLVFDKFTCAYLSQIVLDSITNIALLGFFTPLLIGIKLNCLQISAPHPVLMVYVLVMTIACAIAALKGRTAAEPHRQVK